MAELERITARRSELDALAEELTNEEGQAEREELMIAERVLHRLAEHDWAEAEADAVAPVKVRVAGRAVLLIPHCGDDLDETALPDDYRKILASVRAADGPVQVRTVGEELGLEVAVRGRLEPLRAKMAAHRGREPQELLGQEQTPWPARDRAHRRLRPAAVGLRGPAWADLGDHRLPS